MKHFSSRNPEQLTLPAVLIFLAGLLLLIVQFLPGPRLWPAIPAVCLLLAAVVSRNASAILFCLFTVFLVFVPLIHPALRSWPFPLLLATGACLLFAFFIPGLRPALSWLRPGRLSSPVLSAIAGIAILSGAALYIWSRTASPDLAVHLSHIPLMPAWLLPLAGFAFACSNAAVEELAFRGLVMHAFESISAPWTAVVSQAALFGALHYRSGFPNLTWGTVMTFIYGMMLGGLRLKSGGMLAPWLAHIAADIVIFIILAAQL